jgi:hypothetical protein
MWYPQRIAQGPTSGEVFANSRKDATLVAKNWLPLAVPLSNPPVPQPRRSLSPTPSHSTFTSPAKTPSRSQKRIGTTTHERNNNKKQIQPNPQVFRCQLSMLRHTYNPYPSPESLCKTLANTATGRPATGKWRWCLHKHGDRKSRYAQCVRTRHVGWKVRTRAWRRNLSNLIRNGHEPAHYGTSGSLSLELIMRRKISLWAHYAA